MFDWPLWNTGLAGIDLAYMIGQHLYPEHRARFEPALLEHYARSLEANGVVHGHAEVRLDYRLGLLVGFLMPLMEFSWQIAPSDWVPKMEKLLNGFGIQSWEQLAAFTKADVAKVDAALEDFPGRIERDEWVAQAKAIIKNGHKPVERAPKPKKKPSWQKGTTKLGTPGAGHRDDLKVVHGIGPVLEKTLNDYGIQAWEQLAAFTRKDVATVDEALSFPGRIDRDEWIKQAKELVKRFPDRKKRPTRETFLNRTGDTDPFS